MIDPSRSLSRSVATCDRTFRELTRLGIPLAPRELFLARSGGGAPFVPPLEIDSDTSTLTAGRSMIGAVEPRRPVVI
ncbi:hypothetical protein Pla52o_14390 [Novipirellula galeiformis]|uniref:Uncharacterized protein n=1 Tax=Novipirellula galeiformis TaxID=2528004 RepID=A0A5C6CP32_9BACT|nr:hypothetical protein Pla52o_14390 [Novipirellula galeiformis]